MKAKALLLFDIETKWQEEWKDMPEFVQNKRDEYATINVRFENKEDMDKFSELVGIKVTKNTLGIWFPKRVGESSSGLVYKDEP